MKPTKIALFIVIVLGGLLSLAFFFPKEGVKITDDFTLQFPTIDELLSDSESEVVDITEIIENNQVQEESEEEIDSTDVFSSGTLDDSTVIYYKPVTINPEDVTRKIEYPTDNRKVLTKFFKELSQLKKSEKLIRILHYGDSQIEADRVSSYLRYKLQGQFGGVGPGLVPPVQPYGFQAPVLADYSEGWTRYPGFGKRDTSVKHSRYGVLASFSRYAPYSEMVAETSEVAEEEEREEYNEWIKFEHSPYSYRSVRKYSRCRMFYGYNKYPVNLKLLKDEEEFDKNILLPSEDLQVKEWQFASTPTSIKFEFNGYDSPDVYALALDGEKGVAVDNIPLRGSTGTIFTNSDQNMLSAIYENLNAKLLILQFGGNAAPGMKENYDFYERSFYYQLTRLKKIIPDISIVVIGIADMSQKEKDKYVSYPNVTLIRDALKNAAFKAGCAFWDTYEAMGGQNSMPSWVFSDPPLAEKDFVHFTVKGSRVVAEMFYKALMLEYNQYLKKNIAKNNTTEEESQLKSNGGDI